jgi:TPR repeat protein
MAACPRRSCLGQLFETGGGVVQDTNKAIKYYQLAWQGGLAEAKQALERLGAPLEAPETQ